MKYYTYLHTRNDNGQVFYIGKGTNKRAWAVERNNHWCSIVSKHGFTVQIIAYWTTEKEAFEHEKLLIASFIDMGYNLANKTPGGEGIPKGYKFSEETKRKIALSHLGSKRTEETKQKMSKSSAWRGHTYTTSGMTGKQHTEFSRTKMSISRKGAKQSPEHIAKRFKSMMSNPNYKPGFLGKKHQIITCPHCGKEGAKSGLVRWHYDNCKLKPS